MATELSERIAVDPQVQQGQPCIRGTRIQVSVVLRMLSSGATAADVVLAYPELSVDDVHAALGFAAWLATERTVPV